MVCVFVVVSVWCGDVGRGQEGLFFYQIDELPGLLL